MLAKLLKYAAEARKAVVGLVGVASMLATSGALSGQAETVVQAVLAVATVLGIYGSSNAPADDPNAVANAG